MRNVSLRVDNSPTRSERPRSYGSRPASERRIATASVATCSQSTQNQPVVRDGLTMLVGLIDGVEVIGTADDGIEAVERAQREQPDIVLMDPRMPGMEGAEATRQICTTSPTRRCSSSQPTPTISPSSPHSRPAHADT
jgi:CheY-like chemotaxis protein